MCVCKRFDSISTKLLLVAVSVPLSLPCVALPVQCTNTNSPYDMPATFSFYVDVYILIRMARTQYATITYIYARDYTRLCMNGMYMIYFIYTAILYIRCPVNKHSDKNA